MRLAEFIPRNMEAILVQWEAFASTLAPAATNMTPLALRDHAQQILEAVVADLSTTQTRQAQADKSKGRQLKQVGAPETAAETHDPAGQKRLRHQPTGRRVPRAPRQRPPHVDGRMSARLSEPGRHHPL
jgi:hypothetical protein